MNASIVSFDEFENLKPKMGKIVAVSGGYAPIHPGHISNIQEAKKFGDTLVVIVNGDAFLKSKHGKAFQDLDTRCRIVSAISGVDYVVPFEIENDQTVIKALEILRPNMFAKGGDRTDSKTIPEWETCNRLSIKILPNVGIPKEKWSSSWFLKDWEEFTKES
jgi:cytidyltransferase-like protein